MVLLLAFSLQSEIEKYGAYVGLAAFLGLAVLSLLYFAQAREVRRLREWAGRAPERARELEDRVTAQAQGSQAPRAASAPAAVAAPAAVPAPPAAPPARVGAATAAGAGTGVAVAAMPPAQDGEAAGANGAGEGAKPPEDEKPDLAPFPAASAPGREKKPEAASVADRDGDAAAVAPVGEGAAPADEPKPAAANGAPAPPAFPRPGTAAGAAGTAGAAARPAAPAKPATRPPAMPLRAGAPSATAPPRRQVTLPPRRPAPAAPPPRAEGRSRGTMAVVGGVIAVILAAGVFVLTQVLHDNSAKPKPASTAATPTPTPTPKGGGSKSAPTSRATTSVAVFNGTTQTGLAGSVADKLQAGGFKRGSTGNDTNQQRASSLVYYTPAAKSQGRDVAKLLNISDVRPIDAETQALAGGNADVVVVVGLDQAP